MHCVTHSKRRENHRPPAAASALTALLFLAAASIGCVTRGTYDQVSAERDELRVQKRSLEQRLSRSEASNLSLDKENVALLDAIEDVRISNEGLSGKLVDLEATRARLSQNLEAREAELEQVGEVKDAYESLVEDLEAEVATGQVVIEQLREGLQVNVADDILFASGSSKLDDQGAQVLAKVAARLGALPHRIEVGGHTDNVPIKGGLSSRFPSNWELGAARAASVVRLFASQGIGGERLAAVSFGEFQPVASNETPEDRALNRRIEIRLMPKEDPVQGEGSAPGDVVQSTAAPAKAPAADRGPAAAASEAAPGE